MKKIAIFVFFQFIYIFNAIAQENIKFQVWSDFTGLHTLTEKWKLAGDIGYRLEPQSKDQTIYIRPEIIYSPDNVIHFILGAANFNTWGPTIFNSIEFRTFQFVQLSWPQIGNFHFKHRLGLEQRMFYFKGLEFNEFVHRLRYYLELTSPSFNLFNIQPPFYLTTNFELLTNINSSDLGRLFDHNRFTVGIGNKINHKFKAELRYKVLSFVDPTVKNYIREIDVLRIRLYWQIE